MVERACQIVLGPAGVVFAWGNAVHYNSAMATDAERKKVKRQEGAAPSWGDARAGFEWEFEAEVPADFARPQAQLPLLHPQAAPGRPPMRDAESVAQAVPGAEAVPLGARASSQAARPIPPPAKKYRGAAGLRLAQPVLRLLDAALECWWQLGDMPPRSLLREGLLVLEAGHALDEAQRTLLLRAALYYGAGQLTALHYQTDMERVALLVQEAALIWEPPLAAQTVVWLAEHDDLGIRWTGLLVRELGTQVAAATSTQQGRAAALLAALEQSDMGDYSAWPSPIADPAQRSDQARSARHLMVAALVLAVAGLVWWQLSTRHPAGMVEVPPGSYVVRDPALDGVDRTVRLDGFLIDREEATNRAYRRCAERGACPWPQPVDSATRPNYFVDPTYQAFPVVNVSKGAAEAFCRWAGKRLPTAEEWEVAAGYAPATNRRFRFPWGAQFDVQRANSALSSLGDTVAVGQYRPAGDSMFGASGLAGNVAEWTSSQVSLGDEIGIVVKGGSFADGPDALEVTSQKVAPADSRAVWLGVRCARTLLLDQQ